MCYHHHYRNGVKLVQHETTKDRRPADSAKTTLPRQAVGTNSTWVGFYKHLGGKEAPEVDQERRKSITSGGDGQDAITSLSIVVTISTKFGQTAYCLTLTHRHTQ